MRLSTSVLAIVPLFAVTLAVPFVPKIADGGSSADRALVTKAITQANGYIDTMVTKLAGSSAQTLITNAFGSGANAAAIKTCAQKLQTDKVFFDSVDADPRAGSAAAATLPTTKHIIFGTSFYPGTTAQDDEFRAGTLVHEASHALCSTVDWFDKTTCDPVTTKEGQAHAYNGYANSPDFNTLKTKCAKNMHLNADSYRLMALASASSTQSMDRLSIDQIVLESEDNA